MAESPDTLQNILINYIATNLTEVCTIEFDAETESNKLVFRDPNAYAHENIANQLLKTIDQTGELDDLVMTLFDPSILRLSCVSLQNCSNLSCLGLKALKNHKISSVEIFGLTNISVNDIISCFGEWTLNNIFSLSLHSSLFFRYTSNPSCDDGVEGQVSENSRTGFAKKVSNVWSKTSFSKRLSHGEPFDDQASASVSHFYKKNIFLPAVYIGLCKLKSLQSLDLSDTNLVSHALVNICTDLKFIKKLNISNCNSLESVSCLLMRKDTLQSLSMYNLKILHKEETKDVLLGLKNLLYLDISQNRQFIADIVESLALSRSFIPDLLRDADFGRSLVAIDISGQEEVSSEDLFIFTSSHPDLKFLGLMLTNLCFEAFVLEMEDCMITGTARPSQFIEALIRYPRRSEYITKILYEIFTLSSEFYSPNPDIIKMILPIMSEHKHEAPIQLAGTACLYNLTKGSMGESIHPHILKSVVNATLTAMSNFPNHPQLQKNALLTLCCDRILHAVTFDKYRCARLVLDCLLIFNDQITDRMAVAICSILAAKISTSQTALLGASNVYMEKLLTLVQRRMEEGNVDMTLKFTLSALWNLTDESPATCEVFLNEKGLTLFLRLLETFPKDAAVETKVLGLFNNIAEVSRLKIALINKAFISQLRGLLRSEQVEVSYFAAGIVAHLVCAGHDCWRSTGISRDALLVELGEVVLSWKEPNEEMVAYRSFQPFIPLLMALDKPQVQLWAVWALHHVTTNNGSRYSAMLIREGVDDVLRRLIGLAEVDKNVFDLASKVVSLIPDSSQAKKQ